MTTKLRPLLFALVFAAAGCTDLNTFQGTWSGAAVNDPSLLVGLPGNAAAELHVEAVDRLALTATLTLDEGAGRESVPLRPIARAAADALGALDLPDHPVQSYLLVAPLKSGDAIAVVSLYTDERLDLRLLRSDELYAVFHLKR